MNEINLTVKEAAELKGCSERRVRQLIERNSICAETVKLEQQEPGRGGVQYRIPLSALDSKLQLNLYARRMEKGTAAVEG